MTEYPFEMNCDQVVFKFNKKARNDPKEPKWALEIGDNIYFVFHINTTGFNFSTGDSLRPGTLLFKNVKVKVDKDGNAEINSV